MPCAQISYGCPAAFHCGHGPNNAASPRPRPPACPKGVCTPFPLQTPPVAPCDPHTLHTPPPFPKPQVLPQCTNAPTSSGPRRGSVWMFLGDALEGKGPQRGPQKRLDRRLKEVAKAVGWAVGGGCQSGWWRLLSVTNAIEAGTCRQGDSGWASAGRPGGGGGGYLPLFQCIPAHIRRPLPRSNPSTHTRAA